MFRPQPQRVIPLIETRVDWLYYGDNLRSSANFARSQKERFMTKADWYHRFSRSSARLSKAMIYRSEWWSVDLPPNWSGHRDDACSTFCAEPSLGVLQISTARKETGPVSEDDLREFAADRIALGVPIEHAGFATFSGFTASHQKNGLLWEEWWLRSGHLMVYATYNVDHNDATAEQVVVSRILSSLTNLETDDYGGCPF